MSGPPASGRADATALALAATVRLRIDDERGHSYGTGTIIDVHGQDALLVTCGHIFRESKGRGRIVVELFGPHATGPLEGELIRYSLEPDVALAVNLIHEKGPDGQYLDSPHTLAHFRERWYPTLLDRHNYDNWQAKGSKTLEQRAAERVTKILAEHEPEPLPKDVAQAVHAIVERAEAQYA